MAGQEIAEQVQEVVVDQPGNFPGEMPAATSEATPNESKLEAQPVKVEPTSEDRIAVLEQKLKSELGRAQSLEKQYKEQLNQELNRLRQELKPKETKPEEASAEIKELAEFVRKNSIEAVQEKYKELLEAAQQGQEKGKETEREQKFWGDVYRLSGQSYQGEKFKQIQDGMNVVCKAALDKIEQEDTPENNEHLKNLVENPAYALLAIREHLSNNVTAQAAEHEKKLDKAAKGASQVAKGSGVQTSGKKALKDMSQEELDELPANDTRWNDLPGTRKNANF